MSRLIPFGRWHPDMEGINQPIVLEARNVRPVAAGFAPFEQPQTVGGAVGANYLVDSSGNEIISSSSAYVITADTQDAGAVRGAASLLDSSGSVLSFAGTTDKLYKIDSNGNWQDVTRASGGDYSTTAPERWRFAEFGDYVIATNYVDNVQSWDMTSSTQFANLAGSPPKARYVAVVRDFVVLGNLTGANKRIHWCDINDATDWTPTASNSSDTQDFPDGGPIQGIVGGEVGYVFQRHHVTRMTFVPGSGEIFQFDKLESGRGLFAPDSLVHNAHDAYYVGVDGVYRMNLISGASQPLGVGKWRDWFVADMRPGSQSTAYGALAPQKNLYILAYVSRDAVSDTVPDRLLLYDWAIDEAAFADATVYTMARWLSQGVDLDNMNSYGTLDTLPYSLDSPFWKGGAPLLGVFGADNTLAYFNGSPMEATFITADGQLDGRRHLIRGTRPHIDSTDVTVEIAARERDGDTVTYGTAESMEDTGTVPAWASGNYFRARVKVPAGSSWTYAKGLDTDAKQQGVR